MDWEKTKFGLLSAAGGALVLAVVGFNWGGWMTTGTADAMAKESAANAVAERLGSICIAQFNKDSKDSQKNQKLSEMKAQDAWERGRYIEKQTWAIMPGDEKPDSGVADACAKYFTKQLS
jgi:dienelactone hydrolase